MILGPLTREAILLQRNGSLLGNLHQIVPHTEPIGPGVRHIAVRPEHVRRRQSRTGRNRLDELAESDPLQLGAPGHVVVEPVEVLVLLRAVVDHLAAVAAAQDRELWSGWLALFARATVRAKLATILKVLQVLADCELDLFPRVGRVMHLVLLLDLKMSL